MWWKSTHVVAYMLIICRFNSLSVYWPLKVEFSDPKSVGLEGARNFYLHTDQQVKIGLWWVIVEIYVKFLIWKITLFSTLL